MDAFYKHEMIEKMTEVDEHVENSSAATPNSASKLSRSKKFKSSTTDFSSLLLFNASLNSKNERTEAILRVQKKFLTCKTFLGLQMQKNCGATRRVNDYNLTRTRTISRRT
uniref:Uncharacterized protein n=1 Tax=Romanomermis culicivorax TaxID=13658 RepID=A0A915I2X5_ROMCU